MREGSDLSVLFSWSNKMVIFFSLTLTETFGKGDALFLHTAGWLEGEVLMVCGSLYPARLF